MQFIVAVISPSRMSTPTSPFVATQVCVQGTGWLATMVGHNVSKGDLFCLLPTLFHPLMKMNLSSDQMNLSSDQMNLYKRSHIIIFLLCGGGGSHDHCDHVQSPHRPTCCRKALTDFEMEGQSEWVTSQQLEVSLYIVI